MSTVTAKFYALSIAAAAALFGGCAASELVTPPPNVPQGPCVYLLSTSQVSDISSTHVTAPNCYIYINDTANMSGSTIDAARIHYSGSAPNEKGATFPAATPAPAPAVSDPCPSIPGCSYLTEHPPATSGCSPGFFSGNGQTIGSPGQVTCFSALTIIGENETVCGLIEITGSQLHLNSSSIASCSGGVTFAMSSNTNDTNFSNATLTLSAPQAGNYKDVLFYRVASQNASINFSSCSCNFAGILYFPTAPVNYTSAGGNYQLLIFGQANFSTSGNLRFGNPP